MSEDVDVTVQEAPEVVLVTEPAAPAPAYVTAGELDARLELVRVELGDRVSEAVSAAFAAQAAADDAADAAAVAVVTAEAAAEVAVEAAAAVDEQAAQGDAGEPDDMRAPTRRAESSEGGSGAQDGPAKPRSGYGAAAIFGHRK